MTQDIPQFKTPEELLQFAYANGLFRPKQFFQDKNYTQVPAINPINGSPVYNSSDDTVSLSPEQLYNPTPDNTDYWRNPELLDRMAQNRLNNSTISNAEAENGDVDPTVLENYQQNKTNGVPNFQFYNPYGTFGDLGVASFRLGESIANKNTLGTVAGGFKVGAGLARNFLSGLGYAQQNEKIMEEYRKQQRRYITGENTPVQYEEGGQHNSQEPNQEEMILQEVATALQAGEDPQKIMEALIGMGVDQKTAQGMIEFVMAQLQGEQAPTEGAPTEDIPVMENGGEYYSKIIGRKIKSYTFNGKTGNYDVEIE